LPPIRYNITVREARATGLRYTPEQIGTLIRETRKNLGVTQKDLALTSGTGIRFIIDLEKGKDTCEIGKALKVLNTLGIKITLTPPPTSAKED
jgi:HTH-type transcriptional regulator/antitoxin HipB